MQQRDESKGERTPLERLLARDDEAALEYVTERLARDEPLDPDTAPSATATRAETELVEVEA